MRFLRARVDLVNVMLQKKWFFLVAIALAAIAVFVVFLSVRHSEPRETPGEMAVGPARSRPPATSAKAPATPAAEPSNPVARPAKPAAARPVTPSSTAEGAEPTVRTEKKPAAKEEDERFKRRRLREAARAEQQRAAEIEDAKRRQLPDEVRYKYRPKLPKVLQQQIDAQRELHRIERLEKASPSDKEAARLQRRRQELEALLKNLREGRANPHLREMDPAARGMVPGKNDNKEKNNANQ